MLVRKENKVIRKEGISDKFWKEIDTDRDGNWYWKNKRIDRDWFWDAAWDEFRAYCKDKGLDPDEEDFDAWVEKEDLDSLLEDIFINAGQEYVDYDLDDLQREVKSWLEDNLAGETISKRNMNKIDWGELKNIFDKVEKLNSLTRYKIKYTSLSDVRGKLKDILDDCREVEFNSRVGSNYDSFYCSGYGTDGTSMYELSINIHD